MILTNWHISELISMYHWSLLCGVSLHLSRQFVFESENVIVNFLSHTDLKSINCFSLLETFEETEKGMDFTQCRARKEFADRCFGRELTLQQVTLKVICFLHPQCP